MAEQVLFIGPIAERGGPAIKNRVMTEYLCRIASLKIFNTYSQSLKTRLGAVWAILTAKQKYVIVSVSRKGRNLLYPFLALKRKISGIRYCCVVIGGNVRESFRTEAAVSAMRQADLVTLETRGLVQDLKTACGLSNTYWLPNYKKLEESELQAADPKRFQEEPMRFLFLSSMRNPKGVKTLLNAFRHVLSEGIIAELDFCGPIREDMDQSVLDEIEKAEHIRYCGTVENSRVLETMRKYQVFVFPTEYAGEGFPAVLVEAMAAGLPIISSDMNDNPEIVQDGRNGWIFPHGDEARLAELLRNCVTNREILPRISGNNRSDALQYESDHVLEAFASELRERGWPL